MLRPKLACAALGAMVALVLQLATAQALDATWIAAHGDDNNSCNPTTPCRFLPRAYQQTDPGGRIFVLDSGQFLGTGLVITKAISVVAKGVHASLTGTGFQSKITVNAGPNDVVYLDGLQIIGAHGANDTNGIVFNGGAQLHIRNCIISGFNSAGIRIQAPGPSEVIISDCTIYDNGVGVWARRLGGSGALQVLLDGVTVVGNAVGVRSHNGNAHVRLNDSKIVNNNTGLLSVSDGRLISLRNNVIRGNGANGAPTHNEALR